MDDAGFVHGVLNTDNINITGEIRRLRPWRWLPHYDPAFTAAYFDYGGLYAFGRQAEALWWNLCRLAECLLPFAPKAALEEALSAFGAEYDRAVPREICRRLGLSPAGKRPISPWRRRCSASCTPPAPPSNSCSSIGMAGCCRPDAPRVRPRLRVTPIPPSLPPARSNHRPCPGAGTASGASLFHPHPAGDPADRGGRSDLGADRRTRRLVGAAGHP